MMLVLPMSVYPPVVAITQPSLVMTITLALMTVVILSSDASILLLTVMITMNALMIAVMRPVVVYTPRQLVLIMVRVLLTLVILKKDVSILQ